MATADAGHGGASPTCRCADRGYVRSLEEEDFGFPSKVEPLGETGVALLGRCRYCACWWERLPHWVYGYAWYRTEQRYWDLSAETAAVAAWAARRQDPGI
jgi:hypothetical protein